MIKITFKEIDDCLARNLIEFASKKNMNKSIDINGVAYTLNHISRTKSKFFKSRGLSIYYRVNKSIIRISDHWAESNHKPRSQKFNCHSIDGHYWRINNKTNKTIPVRGFSCGKYPFEVLAGIAGLKNLNKETDHWEKK